MADPDAARPVTPLRLSTGARVRRWWREMAERLALAWKVIRAPQMPKEARIGPLIVIVLKGEPAKRAGPVLRLGPALPNTPITSVSRSTGTVRFVNYRLGTTEAAPPGAGPVGATPPEDPGGPPATSETPHAASSDLAAIHEVPRVEQSPSSAVPGSPVVTGESGNQGAAGPNVMREIACGHSGSRVAIGSSLRPQESRPDILMAALAILPLAVLIRVARYRG